MNGVVHSFEMHDVKLSAYNCEKFFKRLTKQSIVNGRHVTTYNKQEVFMYSCSHERESIAHRIAVRFNNN